MTEQSKDVFLIIPNLGPFYLRLEVVNFYFDELINYFDENLPECPIVLQLCWNAMRWFLLQRRLFSAVSECETIWTQRHVANFGQGS